MACRTCGDKGIVEAPWTDAPSDYALCLCLAGLKWRDGRGEFRYWQAWCQAQGIAPSRLFFLEEMLTPAEMRARGFAVPTPERTAEDREAKLLALGNRGGKR